MQGFILLLEESSKDINQFVAVGFDGDLNHSLEDDAIQYLKNRPHEESLQTAGISDHGESLPAEIVLSLPFYVAPQCPGLLGLGPQTDWRTLQR